MRAAQCQIQVAEYYFVWCGHPAGGLNRTAAPLCGNEEVEMVQASDQDALKSLENL